MKPDQLAKAFNKNVETLDELTEKFLETSDPSNTQALRKAAKRLGTSYSVLPKDLRKEDRLKHYVDAARKLARATGKVRDLDTITSWTAQVTDARDRKLIASDLAKLRGHVLKDAVKEAKSLRKEKVPHLRPKSLDVQDISKRAEKVEGRLVERVDDEFEEFLSTQEVEVMHQLRKDSKRLRQVLELYQNGHAPSLLTRLRSIQDDLGAIRDHDLVIDYLSRSVKPTSTRPLIREEIAKRHARLEEFVTKNRGQGRVVPFSPKKKAS